MSTLPPSMPDSTPLDALRFPLSGSRLIEASAGTGKTYTIAVLYLRLVLGHPHGASGTPSTGTATAEALSDPRTGQDPLMPPQILVATFTQAAADELRDRIRTRLHEAAQLFRVDDESPVPTAVDPVLLALRRQYETADARRTAATQLTRAADWMDEAAIFTIHGWCQRMLIEHAFHSRNLFEQTILTALDPVIEAAAQDYWRIHVYALADNLRGMVATVLGDPAELLRRVRLLLVRDGTPIILAGQPASLGAGGMASLLAPWLACRNDTWAAEQAARQVWRAAGAELMAILSALQPGLNKTTHATLKTDADLNVAFEQIAAWADQKTPLDAKLRTFLVQPKWNKGTQRPDHPAWGIFETWQTALRAETDARTQVQQALWAHAGLWLRQRVSVVLQAQGQMGFDDLLLNLDQALGGPGGEALAKVLRQQFPVALIDEFQDTDPLQFRIFDRVFRITDSGPDAPDVRGTVVLIGDPKQSIYRFRGADIHSYLTARSATTGRHYTLVDNYRSTPGLVHAVNHVFGLAELQDRGAFGYKSAQDNPIPFRPVHARGQARVLVERDRPVPALTGWTLPDEHPVPATQFIERMAAHCASAICEQVRLGEEGLATFPDSQDEQAGHLPASLQPKDIAILVSTGAQAMHLQRALNRHGIKSVYLSDRHRLFASAEAADVYLWLRAMAEPRDLARVRSALATGSFCRRLTELDERARQDSRLDEDVARFLDYQRLWQAQGVLAAVYRLLHDYGIPARLLAGPVTQLSGERRLMNLLHLADWAQMEQDQLDGIDALLQRFLHALAADESEHELRLEQDENLVQIITIHAAKGLQYPVVYLPYLCLIRPSEQASKAIARIGYEGQRRVFSLGHDPLAVEAQKNDELTEGLRLAYVALTRAESACYVGLGPVKFGRDGPKGAPETALGYLLGLSAETEDSEGDFQQALSRWSDCPDIAITNVPPVIAQRYQAPTPVITAARVPQRRHFRPWRISSFSSLTQRLHEAPDTAGQAHWMDEAAMPEPADAAGGHTESAVFDGAEPSADQALTVQLSQLPRGPQIGTMLHHLFELAADWGFSRLTNRAACAELLMSSAGQAPGVSGLWAGVNGSAESLTIPSMLIDLLDHMLNTDLPGPKDRVRLSDLQRYQSELEFWVPVTAMDTLSLDDLIAGAIHPGLPRPALTAQKLQGQLKGFMDLVFEANGRFYVLDYKSNWLGDTARAYAQNGLTEAMLAARYDLQMALYLTALHRHLQDRLPDYSYERHMGGAFYLFVRGIATPSRGVYFHRPAASFIEALDAHLRAPGADIPGRRPAVPGAPSLPSTAPLAEDPR